MNAKILQLLCLLMQKFWHPYEGSSELHLNTTNMLKMNDISFCLLFKILQIAAFYVLGLLHVN